MQTISYLTREQSIKPLSSWPLCNPPSNAGLVKTNSHRRLNKPEIICIYQQLHSFSWRFSLWINLLNIFLTHSLITCLKRMDRWIFLTENKRHYPKPKDDIKYFVCQRNGLRPDQNQLQLRRTIGFHVWKIYFHSCYQLLNPKLNPKAKLAYPSIFLTAYQIQGHWGQEPMSAFTG